MAEPTTLRALRGKFLSKALLSLLWCMTGYDWLVFVSGECLENSLGNEAMTEKMLQLQVVTAI